MIFDSVTQLTNYCVLLKVIVIFLCVMLKTNVGVFPGV